jgi:calcium permeable stress-gated cation channel
MVDKIGLDAALFLRFLRMMRWLFTSIAFLTCAVLIPINITNSVKNVTNPKKRDALSVMTIRDVHGDILFVHVAATYVITFILMGFVWMNWKAVIRLRAEWFRSPEYLKSFYARTLMITNVPRKLQSDEGLRAIFESTQAPYPTTAVNIGRHVGRLSDLIEFHNEAVRELEKVLVKYLKGGKIAKTRPTVRVGGFMCFGGEKKDAIDLYTYGFLIINVFTYHLSLIVQRSNVQNVQSTSIVTR